MSTKVKGLLKGLRYISQIFDEEKEGDMVIGLPTDVKHVAHIGWDGPSVDSPSWMKDFEASPGGGTRSAPLTIGDMKDTPEIKSISTDLGQGGGSRPLESPGRSEVVPKAPRRISSTSESLSGGGTGSPRKEKSRHSRRHHSKESADGAKSSRQSNLQDGEGGSQSLPDLPKKSRRKKSKESVGGEGSSRRKGKSSSASTSQNPDQQDPESSVRSNNGEHSQTSSRSKGERREESSELS